MNHIINLKNSHFKRLILNHYSLDEVFLLQLAQQGYCLDDFKEKKIALLVKKMARNGLITDEGAITRAGSDLYGSLFGEEEELPLNRMAAIDDDFESWWKQYPPNDGFEYKGKKFLITRSMRIKKEDCRVRFHKILSEGKYTAQQLINALLAEVEAKKELSITKKANQLSYMSATLPYLNGGKYEGFIDIPVEGNKEARQTQKFM